MSLPELTLPQVIERYPAHRQSVLGEFDSCRLMTRFNLEGYDFTNPAQARGILFHRFAAEVLRTCWATGEVRIPHEEAMQILYEVCGQDDVPDDEVVMCPAYERRLLRMCAIKFVSDNSFNVAGLMAVEDRLFSTVYYDAADGERIARQITGQPDALIAEGEGIVVKDWKTTQQAPPEYKPRDGVEKNDHGRGLSYLGYFQQRTYAKLVLDRYPAASWVRLEEQYPMVDAIRQATVLRVDLEHIERELATLCKHLDRALAGGSKSKVWAPTPGKHCSYCPRPSDCPISAKVRIAQGGITSDEEARRMAGLYVLATRDKDLLTEALKNYVGDEGAVPVKSGKGRYEVRWKYSSTGSRSFGLHVPDASDRGPDDPELTRVFELLEDRVAA